MKRIIGYLAAAALGLGVVFGAGLWAGLALNDALQVRSSVAFRVKVRLEQYYNSVFRNDRPDERAIQTTHLTLREQTVFLPLGAADFAGGITAVDGVSLVLLDRTGTFFHIDGTDVQELENLAAPENNIAALEKQVDAGDFGKARVDFKWFRYNDVLHLRVGDRAWLLASYTEWQPESFCFNSTLARLEVPADAPPGEWRAARSDWEIVTRTEPCLKPFAFGAAIKGLEAGGRLAHEGGSNVIWTSGSYERDDRHEGTDFSTALAQRDDGDYGKILRVNIQSGATELLAKGLRNPQGLTIDREGRIWVTDHGMRGGDELNLVTPGANFGYPAVSYGTRYDKRPAGNRRLHAGHEDYDLPEMAFVPGIAPGSALALDNFHYAWDGDILIGAFRGFLYRVHIENGRAAYAEPIKITVRPRDMAALSDGRVAVWTDDRRLLYFWAESGPDPVVAALNQIAQLEPDPVRLMAADTFDTCLQCHALDEGDHQTGPSLHGICGRAPGTTGFEGYSGALGAVEGVWTREKLAAFIADPTAFAPETSMVWAGLEDRSVADAIAGLFCTEAKLP